MHLSAYLFQPKILLCIILSTKSDIVVPSILSLSFVYKFIFQFQLLHTQKHACNLSTKLTLLNEQIRLDKSIAYHRVQSGWATMQAMPCVLGELILT